MSWLSGFLVSPHAGCVLSRFIRRSTTLTCLSPARLDAVAGIAVAGSKVCSGAAG